MLHWFDLLTQRLTITPFPRVDHPVPFSVLSAEADHWRDCSLERSSSDVWVLRANTDSGLEANWSVRFFDDTRSLECWGFVENAGKNTLRHVRECSTIDWRVQVGPEFGDVRVRTVNGVMPVSSRFPPYDFAVEDTRLLSIPQQSVLELRGCESGRSSTGKLPCLVMCDQAGSHGLGLFVEWSGLWHIRLVLEAVGGPGRTRSFRLWAGMNGLDIDLGPGEQIPLPRLLITAFDGNLEVGSNSLRRHIRRHVTPKLAGREVLPPTSFNHWFAFQNEFTADQLKPAVEASAEAGLEYFVVDSGWFVGGFREGIGNWETVDRAKFPDGVEGFAEFVSSKGLKYGTWFEPEWAHKDSALCREHPEWFQLPGADPALQSYVDPSYRLMDFGIAEVRQYLLNLMKRVYDQWRVRWIRWDCNQGPRPYWDADAASGEVGWKQIRHVLGLYETLDMILEACPDLLIEQCASGGNRIDLGTVRRGHTFWMNDITSDSDLVRFFQHGLNTILPGNYPNTNLCQFRHDYADYDFLSHGCGGFGYSGRLWEAPREDFERLKHAIAAFKGYRHLLLEDFHRPTGQQSCLSHETVVVFGGLGERMELTFRPDRTAICSRAR